MRIGIQFVMEPARAFWRGWSWDEARAARFARELGRELGYGCSVSAGKVIYQLCPEGFVWMTRQAGRLVGEAQTSLAGPGFHRAAVHFLELFAARAGWKLTVRDATGFYAHRDFERLRREWFIPWFAGLLRELAGWSGGEKGLLGCWPQGYYTPQIRPGMVMTHIREFSLREIRGVVRSGLWAPFSRDFFVWGSEEKDGWYFRNCALVLLNQQCCFMPSSRSREDAQVNKDIIRLLEQAVMADPSIPIPVDEYLEVCALDRHAPIDLTGAERMVLEAPIGCRRGIVYRRLGRIIFGLPGSFLQEQRGRGKRYYDGGREFCIWAVETQGEARIRRGLFDQEDLERTEELVREGLSMRLAFYRPVPVLGEARTVSAQIAYKDQLTTVSISGDGEEWAREMLGRIAPASGPDASGLWERR